MPRPFRTLLAHGIPERFVTRLESAFGPDLNALQDQVLERVDLLRGRESLVVSAPTGAGKTLVAEMAAIARVLEGRTALFLSPTKALAEQHAAVLRARWEPLGLRVGCSTREHRRDDEDIARGRVPLVVAVYEKATGLLARGGSLWASCGLVAADEVQLLGDAERGAGLDLLLSRWRAAESRPQLIALSAVLRDPQGFASWLGVRCFATERRPVPLREGVLDLETGVFRWREAGESARGDEHLLPADLARTEYDTGLAALRRLADGLGPLLRFCATREEALNTARALAERFPGEPAADALARLAACEPDLSRERLEEVLSCGIGLHTADMPALHRRIVEDAFRSGEVPILVATPTLEQGMDFRAATVVHSSHMVDRDPLTGRPALVPLSRSRVLNQGGRAGRRAGDIGRSILMVMGEAAAEQAWRTYIEAAPDALRSPLGSATVALDGAIAVLLRDGAARSREALLSFLEGTLGGRERGPAALAARLDRDLAEGRQAGLWREDIAGHLRLTALGECAAATGISAATLHVWGRLLANARTAAPVASLLFAIGLATEWTEVPMRVSPGERRSAHWPCGLRDRLGCADGLSRALHELLAETGGAPFAYHQAARRTLLLDDWLAGEPLADLERQHECLGGQIARVVGHAAWLARGAEEAAAALGAPLALIESFGELARALLAREEIGQLFHIGGAEPDERDDSPDIPRVIDDAEPNILDVLAAVEAHARYGAQPGDGNARLVFRADNPGVVLWDGVPIELKPLGYNILLVLCRTPGLPVRKVDLYDAVWPDGNADHTNVDYHRRQIARALGVESTFIASRLKVGWYVDLRPGDVAIELGVDLVREVPVER